MAELEAKVEELRALSDAGNTVAIGEEISRLEAKAADALEELYANLTPLAENTGRPPSATPALSRFRARD